MSVAARAVALALTAVLAASCGTSPSPSAGTGSPASGSPASDATTPDPGVSAAPSASPVPAPGHELYGFLPYWEMDDTIAAHVAATPLTTLALFSVTNTSKGAISTTAPGYQRITGATGSAVITAARGRGMRIDLVFTSFGASRNRTFFGRPALQEATIASLVALVARLGLDGLNVDVEGIDLTQVEAYGAFVGRLRTALLAADAGDRLSVATPSGPTGAAMAVAALAAGADRVFLMGYDYRTASSDPGATSPVERTDGGRSLNWSLDLYAAAGVPVQQLLLGLPLYGVTWPVAGPVIGAPATGPGQAWILRKHVDLLSNPAIVPTRDDVEVVEVYLLGADGSVGPPSPGDSAAGSTDWSVVYVDSPATLEVKLGLAESRGLAGAGFWAIGYERGLAGYTDLMTRFRAGAVMPVG
jgi:spore germination protein YaaH